MAHYYQKLAEKSRSFYAERLKSVRVDIILFSVVLAALVIAAAGWIIRGAGAPRRIELSVCTQFQTLFGGELFGALVEEFEALNPHLRVRAAARDADIVVIDENGLPGLMASSALAPPQDYVRLVSFMDILVYNIDALQNARLDRPPKTRAEFIAAARAVAAQGQVYPFALGLDLADPLSPRRELLPWIWAAGGELLSEDGGLSRVASDAVAFFGQLSREGLLAPDSFSSGRERLLEEFAEGGIAMLAVSSRDIAFLQERAASAGVSGFDITAVPSAAVGRNRLGLSGIYAYVSGESARPEEARVFLAFVEGKGRALARALGAVPGHNPENFPDEYITSDPLLAKAWDIFEAADIVEHYPADSSLEEIDTAIKEMMGL